ncbi:predicted protein [Chaetomium globosum CBS 148.51]|uniref:Uncharacterized protein n=1 Tax=Chaetomium globosum (strain ATCC 6205 / CBS 148.51 / DSM 1962 / NBRC 6347 / NRRL 1970) TaxID=306901 RepID=Q2H9T5_CHAGB|nr:uncharacterized protein CHGG_03019 [Chaetomium globosum CBS 148.51]EAQ91084.1 predicted protein [Chaetomium globosum CBS 148.51]
MAKIPRCQPTNTNASLPWVADRPQKHGRRPALPPTPSRRKKGLAVPPLISAPPAQGAE